MFANSIALGGARRFVSGRRFDSAARGRLTCCWSRDPATGKLIATWSRDSDPQRLWDRLEPEPTRLRTAARMPGAFHLCGEALAA